MNYRLKFLDNRAIKRTIDKQFKDRNHLDNFIAYMERTKEWMLDELHKLDEDVVKM